MGIAFALSLCLSVLRKVETLENAIKRGHSFQSIHNFIYIKNIITITLASSLALPSPFYIISRSFLHSLYLPFSIFHSHSQKGERRAPKF